MPRKQISTRWRGVPSVSITYYGQHDTTIVALKNRLVYALGQYVFDVCSFLDVLLHHLQAAKGDALALTFRVVSTAAHGVPLLRETIGCGLSLQIGSSDAKEVWG